MEEKTPSHDTKMEQIVLGAVLLERQAIHKIKMILKPESFYKEIHQTIYECCLELEMKTEPIDLMTVVAQLRKKGQLTKVGGPSFISSLTNNVSSAANIETHAMLLLQHSIKRQHVTLGNNLISQGHDPTVDIMDTNEQISTVANDLLNIIEPSKEKNNVELIRDVMANMDFAAKHEGITGVQSGFGKHDECTNGWQNGDLVYIAARPAMGKTAYVLTQAKQIAFDFKKDAAIFSLEMKGDKLMSRLISAESQIPLKKIQTGKIDGNERIQFNKSAKNLEGDKLHIFDDIRSINGIKSKCLELHLNGKLDIVFIDYLQLIEHPSYTGNREGEVSKISRMLKLLAMQLNVPIVCLSQLSRKVEERSSKRPQLSDLRDSGSIEQDADVVEFVFRPAYYKMKDAHPELALILIQKHRNGELATIDLRFKGEFVQFTDWHDGTVKPFDPNNLTNDDDLPY
jgi:replicative DNA helicase